MLGDFSLLFKGFIPFRQLITDGIVGLIGKLLQDGDDFVGQVAVVSTLLDCGSFRFGRLRFRRLRLFFCLRLRGLDRLSDIFGKIERICFVGRSYLRRRFSLLLSGLILRFWQKLVDIK